MADLNLDILITPTYNKLTLAVMDISTYPDSPPTENPSISITVPGFDTVTLDFVQNDVNIFTSETLGITSSGDDLVPLPDGNYTITYSVTPAFENYVTKTIIRVEKLQEKFDSAFMKLDMMECDRALKKQSIVDLNTIYFFIQSAIASANECAIKASDTLYCTANDMLNKFLKNNCNCTGSNYIVNFQ